METESEIGSGTSKNENVENDETAINKITKKKLHKKQPGSSGSSQKNAVNTAEIKLCAFFAEHNIPFRAMDHLVPLIKDICKDPKVVKEITLKRTKAKNIITNVIAESHKAELCATLKTLKFSMLVDESTDISVNKTACIIVRYFCKKECRVVSSLWEYVPIFQDGKDSAAQGNADHFFNIIINTFLVKNIPTENIIGFASDGCNMMMGAHNSVASRFKALCPGIIIFKCICHSLHICSSQACKALPRTCEDLARNIYMFFKSSSKRQFELKEFQHFVSVDIHKILHPSQTRWLSLGQVVERIIEQWPALQLYFNAKYLEERLLSAEQVHQGLNDPFIKLYFHFLNYILPKMNSLNAYFQSEKVVVCNLYSAVESKYTELLLLYMERTYIMKTPLSQINPENATYFCPLNNLYLGVEIAKSLNCTEIKNNPNAMNYFLTACRNFLQIAGSEIAKRFDFENELLSQLHIFNPSNALSHDLRSRHPSLLPILNLVNLVKRFFDEKDAQIIDDEWRALPYFCSTDVEISSNDEIDKFWGKLLECQEFKNLAQLVLNVLSLPHSNAACERLFSIANAVKTKSRNRLITSTINGVLLSKEHVSSGKEATCMNMHVSNDMLSRMTTSNLYHKNAGSTITEAEEDDEIIEIDNAFF